MSGPGTVGAVTTCVPTVTVSVQDGLHTILLSLADNPDVLRALARTFTQLPDHWWLLNAVPAHQALALSVLTSDRSVREALTLTLTPDRAADLSRALEEASWDPDTCYCGEYSTRTDGFCDTHGHHEDTRTNP